MIHFPLTYEYLDYEGYQLQVDKTKRYQPKHLFGLKSTVVMIPAKVSLLKNHT